MDAALDANAEDGSSRSRGKELKRLAEELAETREQLAEA